MLSGDKIGPVAPIETFARFKFFIRFLWIFIDLHGFSGISWISIDFDGFSWIWCHGCWAGIRLDLRPL